MLRLKKGNLPSNFLLYPIVPALETNKGHIMKKIGTICLFALLIFLGLHPELFAEKNYGLFYCLNCHEDDKDKEHEPGRPHFKGHWAGIEFGFNNYLTPDNSF